MDLKSFITLKPGGYLTNGLAYTDYESLVLNSATQTIYSFTVEGGWQPLAAFPAQLIDPVSRL